MIKYLSAFIIFLSLSYNLAAQTYTIETVPNDHLLDSCDYVTNPDKILAPNAEAELNQIIQKIKDSTTAEVAVVLLNSIGNEDIDEFATKLFNYWGIGKLQNNNGLLFIVVMDVREMVLRTGYGLEGVLPDITLAQIIRNVIVPEFKNGDYSSGVINGIKSIYDCLTDSNATDEVKVFAYKPSVWQLILSFIEDYSALFLILVLCIYLFIHFFVIEHIENRKVYRLKKCKKCHKKIKFIDITCGEYLNDIQQFEHKLQSLRHEIWKCNYCGHFEIDSCSGKNSIKYSKCPECTAVAVLVTKTTIVKQPTIYETGLTIYFCECLYCGKKSQVHQITSLYTDDSTEKIAPIINYKTNNSSKTSSGGSWGGGKTGGGGARGNW